MLYITYKLYIFYYIYFLNIYFKHIYTIIYYVYDALFATLD